MSAWFLSLILVAAAPDPAAGAPAAAPATLPLVRLPDLLEEARRKSPEIHAAREAARADATAVEPAHALDDPMLMVQLWNMPVDLSTIPLMVNLTQSLPLGGKRAARRDEAQAMAEGSRAAVMTRTRDVEAATAKAFFDLFLADRTIAVDDEIGRTLESLVHAANARLSAGRGEVSEVLRAEGEALKVQSDREAARARRSAAVAKLVAILDRAPGSDFGPTAEPGFLDALPAQDNLRAQALRQRPELAAAGAATGVALARLRTAEAAPTPDIALSAGEMHMFRSPTSPADFLFLGVQGNLPIFSGKNHGRIEAARASVEATRADARALQNRVLAEVADAFAEVQAEQREIELHHRLIPVSRQALTSALASFVAGRGGFAMVLDAERDLQMHELDLAMHVTAYAQHLADLERAVGGDVGLLRAAAAGTSNLHQP
jgi:cobalt-zinc-cadmium efflux system outer membrane protein